MISSMTIEKGWERGDETFLAALVETKHEGILGSAGLC